MKVVRHTITFPSVTGLADITAKSWEPRPKAKAKGVIQIAHGMAEHIGRYEEFATFLASNGYAVFANDHIGHGKSVSSDDDLGYFGTKNYGGAAFIADCKQLQNIAVKKYPGLPVVFFGHSMGSFIARRFSAVYGDTLDAAIYCGTAPKNIAAPVAIKLSEFIAKQKGERFRSELINSAAFMDYNKYTEKRTPFDWLTRRQDVVDEYIADDKCGFLFTALGFRDLFSLLDMVSGKNWYERVPIRLPILVVSGSMDPVGGYGKVADVAKELQRTGHRVTTKLFRFGRHEILNETNSDKVYQYILDWIDTAIVR